MRIKNRTIQALGVALGLVVITPVSDGGQVSHGKVYGGERQYENKNTDQFSPRGLAVDAAGTLYITDFGRDRVYKMAKDGTTAPVTTTQLRKPRGVAVDTQGNLYVTEPFGDERIRKIAANGTITTVAGNGTRGYSGHGGLATGAAFDGPEGVAVDTTGNLYIADHNNNVIRKIGADGAVATIVGNGTRGYCGDGSRAIDACLNLPDGIAVDIAGNLYIADVQNHRVRKVTTDGTITTAAGNGAAGFSGDGGPATKAQLAFPTGVAVDAAGALYISDRHNNRVRKVTTDGTITTVAGNGSEGYSGDGGLAINAQLNHPEAVAVDVAGNLYVADPRNNVIRRVFANGTITTVAVKQ